MKSAIIGLGLIGGSLGLALKETRLFKRILGYDHNALHEQQALSLGLVDECVSIEELQECDVIFIAIPLDSIIPLINSFKDLSPTQTLIDLGSTKSSIIQSINPSLRKNYIGAHPMSGTEYSGPKAAQKDLFKNQIVVLTDTDTSGAFQVAFAKEIFINIGMQIIKMTSLHHDKHIAYISHLPHILSFALANTVLSQEEPKNILALIGGGFKSMSRLSNSSPTTWRDIFKHNKDNLLDSMEVFQKHFSQIQEIIAKEDWEALYQWLKNANLLHTFF